MNNQDATESLCIATFSKVTATVSHEIKNALSIINENAGLLEDLVQVTPPEEGVSPERVSKAAASIARQVDRANTIMGSVNRFAHSADHLIARESLHSICSLMISLTQRQALSKSVEISLNSDTGIEINTYLLHLESLIYLSLREIIDQSEGGEPLRVGIGSGSGNEVFVGFSAASLSDRTVAALSEPTVARMMGLLGASMVREGDTVRFTFSSDIQSGG